MPLRQRNLVTAVLAYFMAFFVVALPAVPVELFSGTGLGLVALIGTPVALIGAQLNTRAEADPKPKGKGQS